MRKNNSTAGPGADRQVNIRYFLYEIFTSLFSSGAEGRCDVVSLP